MPYSQSKGQADKTENLGKIIYIGDGTNFYPVAGDTTGHLILSGTTFGGINVQNTETIQTALIAAQTIAASTQVVSSVLSVVGIKKASFFISHGRASTANFGTNGTEYRIEGSAASSGNDQWLPLASVLCASTACLAIANSAAGVAAQTSLVITSGTSVPSVGDVVVVANTSSAASSEWLKVTTVTGTASFTILDGLTYAFAAADTIYTQAELIPVVNVSLDAVTRIRAVVNNNASGTTLGIRSRVACITEL